MLQSFVYQGFFWQEVKSLEDHLAPLRLGFRFFQGRYNFMCSLPKVVILTLLVCSSGISLESPRYTKSFGPLDRLGIQSPLVQNDFWYFQSALYPSKAILCQPHRVSFRAHAKQPSVDIIFYIDFLTFPPISASF